MIVKLSKNLWSTLLLQNRLIVSRLTNSAQIELSLVLVNWLLWYWYCCPKTDQSFWFVYYILLSELVTLIDFVFHRLTHSTSRYGFKYFPMVDAHWTVIEGMIDKFLFVVISKSATFYIFTSRNSRNSYMPVRMIFLLLVLPLELLVIVVGVFFHKQSVPTRNRPQFNEAN